jgi:hypothetical protein
MEMEVKEEVKKENKKILIGLPNTGYYHFMTVSSLVGLQIPEGYTIGFRFVSNCLIYDAREKLCEYALENKFDYILMIDADMVIPELTVKYFLETLEKGADLMTGMIFKRSYPFQPCFYSKARLSEIKKMVNGKEIIDVVPDLEGIIQWKENDIIELQAMGMACCMLRVAILNKIKKPWFYPFPHIGEDITFCIKGRQEAKMLMFCDTRVDVGHLTISPVTSVYQREALAQWESDPKNQGKLLYMNVEE